MTIYEYQNCDAAAKAALEEFQSHASLEYERNASVFFDQTNKVWVVRMDGLDQWYACPNRVPYERASQ